MQKPSRADLLRTIAELQNLIGVAVGAAENDRSPDRMRNVRATLEAAHELCVSARAFDPPTARKKKLPAADSHTP